MFEYYRDALLSSPKAVTVKAACGNGNDGAGSDEEVCRQRIDRFAAESWAYAKGAMQALTHTKDILSGKFDLTDAPGFEGDGKQVIKGGLGKVISFPSDRPGLQRVGRH